ncbi:hypothetical protein C7974DRAFT_415876 [Boeremia exigua]|uniref:uncharacterized protein n=1 Tax=Boeremia exigua TaxID=749465 RepID=UPI001E8E3B42|nr:uncharacterized protein C7974DRAFT_415876 [Boeremia exigua]KAH6618503.1 hypothetical protein C7974DRAFT_415876 [Boeremia exigua]
MAGLPDNVNIVTSSLDAEIYRGFWMNRSVHFIEGATLTLGHRSGELLIAFLALYVNASGRGLWKLVRCILYFKGSSQASPDGPYLQRQATLRNSNLALDAVVELLDIWRTWRQRVLKSQRKTLDAAFVALLVAVGFILAGIFSSRVSQGTKDVLISGPTDKCGVNLTGVGFIRSENQDVQAYIAPFLNQKSGDYLKYAQRCYQEEDKSQLPDECYILPTPTLPYTKETNAPCPFPDKAQCKLQYGNLIVETELLDGYKHLGLNRGPPLTMRVKHHCAPLNVTADTTSSPGIWKYYLGARKDNLTFESKEDTSTSASSHRGNYVVYAVSPLELESRYGDRILFIDGFNVKDTSTTMLFLVSSFVNYLNKTDDPWFSATKLGINGTYSSDQVVSVIGCTTKREYCNPQSGNCVQVYQKYDKQEAAFERAWSDEKDREHLRPIAMTLHQFGAESIGAFFGARNVPNLLARQTLRLPPVTYTPVHANQTKALPSDQWQKEMVYLSQANFAAMQHSLVDYARGSWLGGDLCDRGICRRQCRSQRVRSSKHYSFSVLGMSIILIVGGIIQFLAFFLDEILALLFKFRRIRNNEDFDYAYAEWQVGSTLQLQRLAHEGVGAGTWTKATDLVPVTRSSDTLAVLDVRDRDHPRLVLHPRELTVIHTNISTSKNSSTRYERLGDRDEQ